MRTEGPAPQGLQNSALGFNPGKPHNNRFALKGRELSYPICVRRYGIDMTSATICAPRDMKAQALAWDALKGRQNATPKSGFLRAITRSDSGAPTGAAYKTTHPG